MHESRKRGVLDRCVAFDSAGGVGAAGVALHLVPRSGAQRQQNQTTRLYLTRRMHRICCRFPADRGTSHAPTREWCAGNGCTHQRKRGALAPARAVHTHDSPDTTNCDLGAGQTQTTRSGSSGRDAARAPSGHGCPFGAGPRSVAGVRVPEERGPNQEPGTFGYFWCLFKSDPPEGRKGESAPPEKMDLPTIPMPHPHPHPYLYPYPTNPPTANQKPKTKNQKAPTLTSRGFSFSASRDDQYFSIFAADCNCD